MWHLVHSNCHHSVHLGLGAQPHTRRPCRTLPPSEVVTSPLPTFASSITSCLASWFPPDPGKGPGVSTCL